MFGAWRNEWSLSVRPGCWEIADGGTPGKDSSSSGCEAWGSHPDGNREEEQALGDDWASLL